MLKRAVLSGMLFTLALATVALAYLVLFSPYKVYIVHTGSMGNTIPSRSAVIVHEGQYHTGQVVTFTVNDETVTHRLVTVRPDGTIITKGDANRSEDSWQLSKSNIIGGVVAAPRALGWLLEFFRQPFGVLGILLLGTSAVMLWKSDSPTTSQLAQAP